MRQATRKEQEHGTDRLEDMSRADDAAELDRLLARVSMHSRLARVALKRVPEGARDGAWLDALDEVREVLDLATGLRVKFGQWSDEANKTGAVT